MTGPKPSSDDINLDGLFDEARAVRPLPSEALQSRIVAEAAKHQPMEAPKAAPPTSRLRAVLEGLGGWPALGGLVTATVAGVYIGVVQPDLINFSAQTEDEAAFDTTELWPGDVLFFEEG